MFRVWKYVLKKSPVRIWWEDTWGQTHARGGRYLGGVAVRLCVSWLVQKTSPFAQPRVNHWTRRGLVPVTDTNHQLLIAENGIKDFYITGWLLKLPKFNRRGSLTLLLINHHSHPLIIKDSSPRQEQASRYSISTRESKLHCFLKETVKR